jgi:hypothetical protein
VIDPVYSLAFSVQANPGVYAMLLGSGVSRGARIPTGWEITLDLIRKLALVSGENAEPDPEKWYRDKFGKVADYSDILDALGKTPAERQQLIRSYVEPTPEEREEGIKRPTAAHRAVAALAAQGMVRVIITTNFDRLMETALGEAGMTPTVLSTPDQISGAMPLIHTQCCVFKVHGDYLDTRIRNSAGELAAYPKEFDTLLDRVLDEFGLIVCGWSSDWDPALRSAITRSPARRFTTYWASRGDPSATAQALILHRAAQLVRIADADSFLSSLQRQVEALQAFSRPHPLSTEAAVASMKKFLSEPKYRIQLNDLIIAETERVADATSVEKFPTSGVPAPDAASLTARVRAFEAASDTLMAMASVGGYWAEPGHYPLWQRALARIVRADRRGDYQRLVELQVYPGVLLLYAAGLGAVAGDRLGLLGALFGTTIDRESGSDVVAVQLLPPFALFDDGGGAAKFLEGKGDRKAPLNDWLHEGFLQRLAKIVSNKNEYTYAFDRLEMLIALGFAHHAKQTGETYWAPTGAFGYRGPNRERFLKEIADSLSSLGDKSKYVTASIFGTSATQCATALSEFSKFMTKARWIY